MVVTACGNLTLSGTSKRYLKQQTIQMKMNPIKIQIHVQHSIGLDLMTASPGCINTWYTWSCVQCVVQLCYSGVIAVHYTLRIRKPLYTTIFYFKQMCNC